MQVLEENELSCVELMHVKSDGVVLTKQSMCTNMLSLAQAVFLCNCFDQKTLVHDSKIVPIIFLKISTWCSQKLSKAHKNLNTIILCHGENSSL
jgi:hypothetical protein